MKIGNQSSPSTNDRFPAGDGKGALPTDSGSSGSSRKLAPSSTTSPPILLTSLKSPDSRSGGGQVFSTGYTGGKPPSFLEPPTSRREPGDPLKVKERDSQGGGEPIRLDPKTGEPIFEPAKGNHLGPKDPIPGGRAPGPYPLPGPPESEKKPTLPGGGFEPIRVDPRTGQPIFEPGAVRLTGLGDFQQEPGQGKGEVGGGKGGESGLKPGTDQWGNPAGGTPMEGVEGGVIIKNPDGSTSVWIKGELWMTMAPSGFMAQPEPGGGGAGQGGFGGGQVGGGNGSTGGKQTDQVDSTQGGGGEME